MFNLFNIDEMKSEHKCTFNIALSIISGFSCKASRSSPKFLKIQEDFPQQIIS